METFGVKFGRLVREKRGIEDLTQSDLAALANLTPPQISSIENGKVSNPQVKTVDALCVALNISQDERAACHPPSDKRLPPKLVETLAEQFGIENPGVSEETLESFLRAKAIEFREMQARLTALTKTDARISNLLAAAQDALEVGQFDYADERLADAEDIQQEESTLAQVRKQANLRVERAKASLLLGNVQRAFEHLMRAASFFAPFDRFEEAQSLFDAGETLRNYGMRYPGSALHFSVQSYERALEIWTRDNFPEHWAKALNYLAIALRRLGSRTAGGPGCAFIERAIVAYRMALEVRTRDLHPGLWGITQNNLACALRHLGTLTGGDDGKALLIESIGEHRAALEVRNVKDRPQGWGVSQNNLAVSLRYLGIAIGGEEGDNYLTEAASVCRAALEVRTKEEYPVPWAITQNNLAGALIHRSDLLADQNRTSLLQEAVEACLFALEVRTRDEHPIDWAESKENLARAYSRLAAHIPESERYYLSMASSAVEEALAVIDGEYMPSMRHRLEELQTKIADATGTFE